MWLFLSILEWKGKFSKKSLVNKWAIVDGVVTLIPNPSFSSEKEKRVFESIDGK